MDRELVQQLSRLAALELDDQTAAALAARLDRILLAFASLQQVNTTAVTPSSYPLPLALRLRPDEPGPVLARDAVLANARQTAGDAFLVPRVVDA